MKNLDLKEHFNIGRNRNKPFTSKAKSMIGHKLDILKQTLENTESETLDI